MTTTAEAIAEATGADARAVQDAIDALAGCDPFAGLDVPFDDHGEA